MNCVAASVIEWAEANEWLVAFFLALGSLSFCLTLLIGLDILRHRRLQRELREKAEEDQGSHPTRPGLCPHGVPMFVECPDCLERLKRICGETKP